MPVVDESANSEHASSALADSLESLNAACLQIQLPQAGWIAKRGESLAIAGHIHLADSPASESLLAFDSLEVELEGAIPQEIQVQLRDPQTSEILFHACQSFPQTNFPFPFSFLCSLPEQLATHLLLGDVLIAGALPGAEGVLVTLKSFNFTVTVDPEALVEELHKVTSALVENADSEELPEAMVQLSSRLQKEKARQGLDLSFLNMAPAVTEQPQKTAEVSVPVKTSVAARHQILPPQLYHPEANPDKDRKLELPAFVGTGGRTATAIAEPPAAAIAEEDVFSLPESGLDLILASDSGVLSSDSFEQGLDVVGASFEGAPVSESSVAADSAVEPQLHSSDRGAADLTLIDELSSPIRSEFQALNLQERFLDRLSSIAADTELTALLKESVPPVEETTAESATGTERTSIEAATPELVQDLPTEEIVVDDDPSWREWLKRAGSRTKRVETAQTNNFNDPAPANPLVLPNDEPVPVPILEMMDDEIVAGKLIRIRVKLPDLAPKIYVKLWVNDRQTRSLLDGPRWLVDFLPNGFGELEANTQLIAPLGSVEMRIEAIAVEMQTQRESQKVGLDREVLPADVPDDLFSDLDLQGLGF